MSFPSDFWSIIRPYIDDDTNDQLASLSEEVVQYFGGPRDIQLVCEFLAKTLPSGRIYVYGAGSHSEAIFSTLTSMDNITILGFLDRAAKTISEFHNIPVILPEEVVNHEFDYILISYDRMEMELVDRICRLGIPRDKIQTIYSCPDYISFASDVYFSYLQRRLKAVSFEYVIIRSRVHEIINDEALARIFPPEKTLTIHIGPRHLANREERWFWCFDVQKCMALASRILKEINPKLVFLSTEQEYDLAYFMVRHTLPQTPLFHEIYDFFPIIPDDWIERGIEASPRVIQLMRLSNYYSSQHSQIIVSKRAGVEWTNVTNNFAAQYLFVFPGINFPIDDAIQEVNPQHLVPQSEGCRILYAGALVPSNFDVYKRSDYNFLPMLEALAQEPGFEIDIYNSSHGSTLQNPVFSDYIENYANGRMRYYLRIPYNMLLKLMPNYHYGWLCLPPREMDLADQLIVICNRFSAYIYGGLPIIIDAEWHFIASLVEKFNAGIVIADATPEKVQAAIANADYPSIRAGVRRLSAYMQRHNREVIEELRQQVQRAARCGMSGYRRGEVVNGPSP